MPVIVIIVARGLVIFLQEWCCIVNDTLYDDLTALVWFENRSVLGCNGSRNES
jgi:hypothetical protein